MSVLATRLAIAVGLMLSVVPVAAHLPERAEPPQGDADLEPQVIVAQFLGAVARGNIEVFGTRITTDRLAPRRVECVYDLQSNESMRQVYAELMPPIPMPEQPECEARGISVLLDAFGGILETSAHIWCE